MQAELFGQLPFLPQKLRRFLADLVAVMASMTEAIDALQAARDQVPGRAALDALRVARDEVPGGGQR